ncbi:MAG: DNA translocase FtsK [Flavobacteriales bacterium]|nr:DNA translocase FtsK [Flavobacteriales bacterium]MDW8409653.1 DNA translocase FtsK 4TM domain-containing protein [Flavobacteriales bacterium]
MAAEKKKPSVTPSRKEKGAAGSKGSTVTWKNIKKFLTDPKTRKATGLLLLALAVFILLSCVSFFFTYPYDEAVAQTRGCRQCTEYRNLMGRWGALTGAFLVSHFGVGILFWIPGLFLLGLYLLWEIRTWSAWKYIGWAAFLFFWVNLLLGFLTYGSRFDVLGGLFGYGAATYFENNLGKPGVLLLLAVSAGLFLLVALNVGFFRMGFWVQRLFTRRLRAENQNPDSPEREALERGISPSETAHSDPRPTAILPPPEGLHNALPEDFEFPVYEKSPDVPAPGSSSVHLENPVDSSASSHHSDAQANQVLEVEWVGTNATKDHSAQEGPSFEVEMPPEEPKVGGASEGNSPSSGEGVPPVLEPYDPRRELPDYVMPNTDLLTEHGSGQVRITKEELEANKDRIVKALANYNIPIEHIKATIGPTVTLYEIVPAAGIRISRIKSLEDDIALSLAAFGIRIIAPIPGKGTIGIEVPNQNPEVVSMKSVLESDKYKNSTADLPIALGKTISNETYVADLTKMPHLLIAGATGQGKSVGINAILVSLLYKKHPSELKLVLVDPKKVELTLYQKLERHYLAKLPDAEEPIITDTKKVIHTLQSLCVEMDRRYDLLKNAGVRTINEYNSRFIARRLNPKAGHRYLPYIVLVIDEFADLIMTAGKEVEMPLARLAQLARAVGIHLIIATQRPSVNIITGTIKANFPARIAFRVSAKVDSRTILDAAGADQLVGRGDMLLSLGSELVRLQCAFVDTTEVERLCDFIARQPGYPTAFELPEAPIEAPDEGGGMEFDAGRRDPLFEEAARIVVMTQQGSTSMLQRRMRLGYSRAGRIMDELEKFGIVGPNEGSKTRKVLIQDLETLEQYLKNFST